MARKAVLAPLIYETVNRLVEEGTVESNTQAFQYIIQHKDELGLEAMTGKSDGTVAASYYRQKRKLNGTAENGNGNDEQPKPRKARRKGEIGGGPNSTIEDIAEQVNDLMGELVRRAKRGEKVDEALRALR